MNDEELKTLAQAREAYAKAKDEESKLKEKLQKLEDDNKAASQLLESAAEQASTFESKLKSVSASNDEKLNKLLGVVTDLSKEISNLKQSQKSAEVLAGEMVAKLGISDGEPLERPSTKQNIDKSKIRITKRMFDEKHFQVIDK